MLDKLRHARDLISMEAITGNTAADKAAERLPSFLSKASDFLTKNIFQPIGDFFSIKNLGWLAINAQRKPYSELRGMPVRAPQGFKGTLAEYGAALIGMVQAVDSLQTDVLDPYAKWVSERIDDPSSLKSLTHNLKIPGLRELKTDQLRKQLEHFFPDHTDAKEPIYGDLFKRQADWMELNNQIKKLNTIYASGHYERVQKKVPEIVSLLEVFSARLVESKAEYQFSSITTDQLAKVTYAIAEQVEFYGVLRHRVEEFLRVINDNVELVHENI